MYKETLESGGKALTQFEKSRSPTAFLKCGAVG